MHEPRFWQKMIHKSTSYDADGCIAIKLAIFRPHLGQKNTPLETPTKADSFEPSTKSREQRIPATESTLPSKPPAGGRLSP
jgi:hypothetical protein